MKMKWNLKSAAALLAAASLVSPAFANEGAVPKGIPRLDHVFVILMENHGYNQIIDNPDAPFANKLAKSANTAANYFAIGHPSSTNYLEIVGGSNFGVRSDNNPDWHNMHCQTNLSSMQPNLDTPNSGNVCPIWGVGTDAETPVTDCTNEVQCTAANPNPDIDIDGVLGVPAQGNISGKTIADQLNEAGMSWRTYQENLPPSGADGVNFADGFFTDSSDIATPTGDPKAKLAKLYAAKHNPFVYFRSIQEGGLDHVVPFAGQHGLFADLASGHVPAFSFIAPNQCNDQHGRGIGEAGSQCDFDPNDNGTQVGLNPALISIGDQTLATIVSSIKDSSVWKEGRSAIVVVWDENDYSVAPTINQVLAIVDTNYGRHGVTSKKFYTHFSLLRSLESGLRLPCLNHACDPKTGVMSDLFAADHDED
jgi:hypothetical protein